jgi:hypothetical protein
MLRFCQSHDLNEDQLRRCIENRLNSLSGSPLDRPAKWIKHLQSYLKGPLNQYGQDPTLLPSRPQEERRYQPGVDSWSPENFAARDQEHEDGERTQYANWLAMPPAYRTRNPWTGKRWDA